MIVKICNGPGITIRDFFDSEKGRGADMLRMSTAAFLWKAESAGTAAHRIAGGDVSGIDRMVSGVIEEINYSSHYFSNYNWKKVVKLPVNTIL